MLARQYQEPDNRPENPNRRILAVAIILAALGCILGGMSLLGAELPLGSIVVSRSTDESLNTTPGYWNHLAIYVGDGQLVESVAGAGVVQTPWDRFQQYDARIVVLEPCNAMAGMQAAARAKQLIGLPYATWSSLRRSHPASRRIRGVNCVSVIEIAWQWPCINRPDRVFGCPSHFTPRQIK